MKNNSLREIAQVLHEAESILLFPHVNLDGDALGSCAALCRTLRLQGKNVWIMLEDDIPAFLTALGRTVAASGMDYAAWSLQNPGAVERLAEEYLD